MTRRKKKKKKKTNQWWSRKVLWAITYGDSSCVDWFAEKGAPTSGFAVLRLLLLPTWVYGQSIVLSPSPKFLYSVWSLSLSVPFTSVQTTTQSTGAHRTFAVLKLQTSRAFLFQITDLVLSLPLDPVWRPSLQACTICKDFTPLFLFLSQIAALTRFLLLSSARVCKQWPDNNPKAICPQIPSFLSLSHSRVSWIICPLQVSSRSPFSRVLLSYISHSPISEPSVRMLSWAQEVPKRILCSFICQFHLPSPFFWKPILGSSVYKRPSRSVEYSSCSFSQLGSLYLFLQHSVSLLYSLRQPDIFLAIPICIQSRSFIFIYFPFSGLHLWLETSPISFHLFRNVSIDACFRIVGGLFSRSPWRYSGNCQSSLGQQQWR